MKKPYCIMPWVHVHTRPNGDASPCCVWSMDPLGNIKNQSIDQIAHSKQFDSIRKGMLQGRSAAGCIECREKESSDISEISYRSRRNEEFKDLIPEIIDNTNEDGSLKHAFTMKFMNIRYSNLCNMACRTCGSDNSSLWGQELGIEQPVIKITNSLPNYLDDILNRLHTAEVINFAGGESILIPEHWAVLDKLLELNRTHVRIYYFSNLSKLTYQNKNILDYAGKFPNMLIRGSIDASHERAELYRHGTHWPTVEKNLKLIYDNNINFKINCTIGAMNIWHAPDLERYLLESKLIKPGQFSINMLIQEDLQSAKVLPDFFKREVTEKISAHQTWLKTHDAASAPQWNYAIKFMTSEDHTHLLEKFITCHEWADALRNQHSFQVFPELQPLLDWNARESAN